MKKSFLKLALVCIFVLVFCGVGAVTVFGTYYQRNMPQFPQEKDNWCSIAVSQSFISYLTGYAWPQWQLAYNSTLAVKAKLLLNKGLNAGDVVDILNVWTSKDFEYQNHNSQSDAQARIIKELKEQKHALAFAGNACLPNGTPKDPMGHWMMIIMADVSSGALKGVYVLDPLYGSKFASNYEVVRPYSYMRDLFSKWWLAKNSLRQSVEY